MVLNWSTTMKLLLLEGWESCFRNFQSFAPFYLLQVNYSWQRISLSQWCFTCDRHTSETWSDVYTCVFLCASQSPTAQRCGWWCLWCACRWWLSPFSSLSSSAPWDTTAVCRAPRVRGRVTAASARQSTHRHCSFHRIISNMTICQLCKI